MLDYQQFPTKLFRFRVTILIKFYFFPPRSSRRHDGDIVVHGSVYQLSTRARRRKGVERRLHQRADQHRHPIERHALVLLTCHTYTCGECTCAREVRWTDRDTTRRTDASP